MHLPLLRIAYRKGADNVVADYLCRFQLDPAFEDRPEYEATVPDDLYEKVNVLPVTCGDRKFDLFECKVPQAVEHFWQVIDEPPALQAGLDTGRADATGLAQFRTRHPPLDLDDPELMQLELQLDELMMNCLTQPACPELFTVTELADDSVFTQEREEAETSFEYWEQFVDSFTKSNGRPPVLYDLYTGAGGFARGAHQAGCEVRPSTWV